MHKHWAIVLAVLLLGLATSTVLADSGIGLRWSLAWPRLSPRADSGSPGLHVVPEPLAGDGAFVPRYSLAPLPVEERAAGLRPDDIPPGVSFYYGLSQGESVSRDRSLYQLTSPSDSASRTMGLTVKYPF
ncbi:MAG: hypothetical protein M0015_12135 [Betaproteobacteria bacterium]|nr:hypothetical protein [Betaproteobacteria bacterium]